MKNIEQKLSESLKTDTSDTNKCECCGKNAASDEKHTCPYAEDVNGDHETMCNCCDNCSAQCAADI